MTATELLAMLQSQGVILAAGGEHLHVDAPDSVLTDALLHKIRAHKAELLALLAQFPATYEPSQAPPPLGLPLHGVCDKCPTCQHAGWLVYVTYRRCAACGCRDGLTPAEIFCPREPSL